jgi:putative nucleotidyltransferase with HDIG domain
MNIDDFKAKLEQIMLARIEGDRLGLPAMPAVAARCIELTRVPDVRIGDIVALVERDPVTTASVLKVANSAALGARAPAAGLMQAVNRIGLEKLRTILMQVSVRQIFQSRDRRIGDAFRGLWKHSIAVALLSRDLSLSLGSLDPEAAYQVGLLHDVGKPVVAIMLLEAEKTMTGKAKLEWMNSDQWMTIVQELHRPVGRALTRKWGLPEEVLDAIERCDDYDPTARLSIGNVTRFANAVCKQRGLYTGNFDTVAVDVLVMIGRSLLGLEDETIDKITRDLAERTAELAS